MADPRDKTKIRFRNGDVLITATRERDAKVDEAFEKAMEQVRIRNVARLAAFREARGRAA